MYYAQEFGTPPRTLKMRLGVIAAKMPGAVDDAGGRP